MPKPVYTPLSAEQLQDSLDQLDEMLLDLVRSPAPAAALTLEHLAGVRTYLIDGMRQELALNIDLTEESLTALPDPRLKARIQAFLKSVRAADQPRPA